METLSSGSALTLGLGGNSLLRDGSRLFPLHDSSPSPPMSVLQYPLASARASRGLFRLRTGDGLRRVTVVRGVTGLSGGRTGGPTVSG
jgi:hypothetical protein